MLTVFGKPRLSHKLQLARRSINTSFLTFENCLQYLAMSSGANAGNSERDVYFAQPQQPGAYPQSQDGNYQSRRSDKRDHSGSRKSNSRSRSRDNDSNRTREGGRRDDRPNMSRDTQRGFGRGKGQGGDRQDRQGNSSNNRQWQGQGQCNYQHQGGSSYGNRNNGNRNPGSQYNHNNYQGEWSPDDYTFLSRQLSSILRHNAERFGFKLMKGGFLYVNEILQMPKLHGFTLQDVMKVVAENDKKRFALEQDSENGEWKIRANQGHSLEVECLDLRPIQSADEYPTVIHGTYYKAWELIKETGLRKMNRNHIHFAAGVPGNTGVISGMRSSCEVIIKIDLDKALKAGLKFFVSANNVILSEGDKDGVIYPCFFEGAMDRKQNYRLEFDHKICSARGKSLETESKKPKKKKKNKQGKSEGDDPTTSSKSCDAPTESPDPVNKNDTDTAVVNVEVTGSVESFQGAGVSTVTDSSTQQVQNTKVDTISPNTTPVQPVVEPGPSKDVGNTAGACGSIIDNDVEVDGIDTDVKDSWEDCDDGTKKDIPWSVPEFMNKEKSETMVDKLIKDGPSFVVVCCVGENLGKADSCIRTISVLKEPEIYVYHLHDENKDLVKEGKLNELLLDRNITKVFINIEAVSRALIREYEVLMSFAPIRDIEMMFEKVTVASMDLEDLKNKYEFTKKTFKKWKTENEKYGKKLADPDIDEESLEQVTTQGKCITELYKLCDEKLTRNPDMKKKLNTETYKKAIPDNDKDELFETVKTLKERIKKSNKNANKGGEQAQVKKQEDGKKQQQGGKQQQPGGGGKSGKKKGNKR